MLISHQFGKLTGFQREDNEFSVHTLQMAVPVQRAKLAHRTKQKVIVS